MATLKEKIAQARAAGYSDDEIFAMIAKTSQGKEALASGASPDEIRGHFGLSVAPVDASSQDPNPVTRTAKMVGGGLVRGAAAMADLPGTLIHGANSLLPEGMRFRLPEGDTFSDLARKGGLTDRADAKPANAGERAIDSISTGVGASLPFALGGPAAAILSGAGSGAGEWAANELLPGNDWVQFGASVLGGMTGQSMVRGVEKQLAKKAILEELDSAKLSLDDFETTFPRTLAQQKEFAKTAAGVADRKHEQVLGLIDQSVPAREAGPKGQIASVADGLGPSAGWQDAGEALRTEANSWLKNGLPDSLEAAWKPVDEAVPGDTTMSLGNFDDALHQINRKAGRAQGLVDLLTPSLPKILRAKMDKILEGMDLGLDGFSWSDARKLRTALGDAMRDPKIMPSMGDQNLKQLYAALTEDLGSAAESVGAREAFDAANEASKGLFAIAEGPIAKVLSDADAGRMAKGLVSGGNVDAATLEVLRSVVPKGMDGLGAAGLRAGPDGKLLHDWTRLTPKAKAALVPDAAARQTVDSALFSLDDLGRVVKAEKIGAKAMRDTVKQTAKADLDNWTLTAAEQKLALQSRLSVAEENAKKVSGEASLADEVRAVKRMGIGVAGSVGLDALGVNADAMLNSKTGAALMIAAPAVAYGVRGIVKDPALLRGPTIGAATGNAMMGEDWAQGPDKASAGGGY
jgi:hypothetical protein